MDENKKQTVMAFVRLICSLVAAGAAMFGIAIDAEMIFIIVACVFAGITYLWSWWKNNNVTKAATEAQEILRLIKEQDGFALDPIELADDEGVEVDG